MTTASATPPDRGALYPALQRWAALRDSFHPMALIQSLRASGAEASASDDPVLVAEALSALQDDCIIEKGPSGPIWALRPAVRRKVLGTSGDPALDQALSQAEGPLADALRGQGAFAPEALQAALKPQVPSATLVHLVGTLDRAGSRAPGYASLIALRSALNTSEQRERAEAILSRGFFGRQKERARLADWIASPQSTRPLRSLHISGLPGIGKSFLLEKIIQEAVGRDDPILIRLDFDRSGLMVDDTHAFFEEISRQLGDAVPLAAASLRDHRLQSARERSSLSGREARFLLPRDLLAHMGRIAAQDGRLVLIVMDTLEVLRARGETVVMTLFDHLDRLVEFGMSRVCVVSAGRGDALDPVPDRLGGRLHLPGLEEEAEEALLKARGVPPAQWPDIRRVARGNPLLLTLAARAFAVGQGKDVLAAQSRDPAVRGGYLYRAILSRLPQPLNDLAHAGLVLRRLDPGVLAQVLAPALGLNLTLAQASTLFDDLATQHWLIEADDRPGWLCHRPDMRAAFFPLLVEDRPDLVRDISARAIGFDDLPPLDRLYHRLQLVRWGGDLPNVPAQMAGEFSPLMLDELPPLARDAVLQARGQRSDFGRTGRGGAQESAAAATAIPDGAARRAPRSGQGAAVASPPRTSVLDKSFGGPSAPKPGPRRFVYNAARARLEVSRNAAPGQIDPRAIRDLSLMLANGDQREAAFILRNSFSGAFEARSEAGRAVMCYLWLAGQWAGASRLWRAMGRPSGDKIDTGPSLDPVLTRICDEIFAEHDFRAFVQSLKDRPLPPEPGRVALIGGALDVAGCVAYGPPDFHAKVAPAQGQEYAAALLAPWQMGGDSSAIARLRAEAGKRRERLDLAGRAPEQPGWQVAPMIPHIAPLAALCLDPDQGPRAQWLARLQPHLEAIISIQLPWFADQSSALSSSGAGVVDMIDKLGVLGLTADWAGAMSLALNDGDLGRIAASAERWRRLSHGAWPFAGAPPKDWTEGRGGVDQATKGLMQHLADREDGGATAARLLQLWLLPGGDRALRALGRRLAMIQSRDPAPDAALRHAAKLGLPPGIAAPLALLASLPSKSSAPNISFLSSEI
jgi:hypothetical protein